MKYLLSMLFSLNIFSYQEAVIYFEIDCWNGSSFAIGSPGNCPPGYPIYYEYHFGSFNAYYDVNYGDLPCWTSDVSEPPPYMIRCPNDYYSYAPDISCIGHSNNCVSISYGELQDPCPFQDPLPYGAELTKIILYPEYIKYTSVINTGVPYDYSIIYINDKIFKSIDCSKFWEDPFSGICALPVLSTCACILIQISVRLLLFQL